jgi:hypothetical protein
MPYNVMFCFVTGVTNILTFVENRKLCGTSLHVSRRFKKSPSLKGPKIISVSTVPLDATAKLSATDTESLAEHGIAPQNTDELHIMSFLTDLMCSLRKSIERNGAVGEELTALKIGFNIILGKKSRSYITSPCPYYHTPVMYKSSAVTFMSFLLIRLFK